MKKNLLFFVFVIFSISFGQSQTFTIEQSVTGQNDLTDVRGQSFTPSVLGSGSGSVGTGDTVYLYKFSMIYSYSSSSEADTLYIYSQLPDSTKKIDNGKGGVLIGKSIAKTSDDFPYTDYVFNWIPLNKDLTYYVVFREDINPEASAGSSYAGGSAIRNQEEKLSYSEFLDLKFIASFSPAPSAETDIVSFSVGSQVGSSIINNTDHTISSVIGHGLALGYVSTTIVVSPGATVEPSDSYIDYADGPVTFTVTAEDGVTKQEWTVTVTNAPSYYADIESFSLAEQTGEATILYGNRRIDIEVEAGTDLSALIPTIVISEGASISPNSGMSTDFSSGSVVYTVTAEDETTTKEWTVNVTRALSYYADIESFSLAEQTGEANIDPGSRKIDIEVEAGTDLSALIPTIVISEGASIFPNTGVSADFSSGSVVYTVTAEDGTTTKEWTVHVTVEAATGLDLNNDHPGFYVYPTLFENEFQIVKAGFEEVTFEIYNSLGQLTMRSETKGNITTVNTSAFSKGLYFIKLGSSEKIIKITKQ